MFKKITFFSVLLLFFIATGCQDILECIINRRPELPEQRLQTGYLDKYYFDSFRAEVKNEPRDDAYYYYYSVYGELPRGVDVFFDYRNVIIEGTPLDRGVYRFKVNLQVEQANNYYEDCENEFNDCDGLCEESTSREYVLYVN